MHPLSLLASFIFSFIIGGMVTATGSHVNTGCSLFPKCLECPLPRCRYDMRAGGWELRKTIRNLKIKQGLDEGRTIKELAEEYGLSERTIWRVVAPRCRKSPSP